MSFFLFFKICVVKNSECGVDSVRDVSAYHLTHYGSRSSRSLSPYGCDVPIASLISVTWILSFTQYPCCIDSLASCRQGRHDAIESQTTSRARFVSDGGKECFPIRRSRSYWPYWPFPQSLRQTVYFLKTSRLTGGDYTEKR